MGRSKLWCPDKLGEEIVGEMWEEPYLRPAMRDYDAVNFHIAVVQKRDGADAEQAPFLYAQSIGIPRPVSGLVMEKLIWAAYQAAQNKPLYPDNSVESHLCGMVTGADYAYSVFGPNIHLSLILGYLYACRRNDCTHDSARAHLVRLRNPYYDEQVFRHLARLTR